MVWRFGKPWFRDDPVPRRTGLIHMASATYQWCQPRLLYVSSASGFANSSKNKNKKLLIQNLINSKSWRSSNKLIYDVHMYIQIDNKHLLSCVKASRSTADNADAQRIRREGREASRKQCFCPRNCHVSESKIQLGFQPVAADFEKATYLAGQNYEAFQHWNWRDNSGWALSKPKSKPG